MGGFIRWYLHCLICLSTYHASLWFSTCPCEAFLSSLQDSPDKMGAINLLMIQCTACHINSSSIQPNLAAKWHPTILIVIWLLLSAWLFFPVLPHISTCLTSGPDTSWFNCSLTYFLCISSLVATFNLFPLYIIMSFRNTISSSHMFGPLFNLCLHHA